MQETPSRSSSSSRRRSSAGLGRPRPARTTLLEPKRASSIGIMLGSWRLQPGEIRSAILRHDVTVLPPDRLESVLAALPSPAELRLIRSWLASTAAAAAAAAAAPESDAPGGGPGSELGDAERYFLEVGGVARLEARLRCMLAEQGWAAAASSVLGRLRLLEAAAREVAGSAALRQLLALILEVTLTLTLTPTLTLTLNPNLNPNPNPDPNPNPNPNQVGNKLNARTHRGNARGFELSTLKELATGTKHGVSLGHYLAASHAPLLEQAETRTRTQTLNLTSPEP